MEMFISHMTVPACISQVWYPIACVWNPGLFYLLLSSLIRSSYLMPKGTLLALSTMCIFHWTGRKKKTTTWVKRHEIVPMKSVPLAGHMIQSQDQNELGGRLVRLSLVHQPCNQPKHLILQKKKRKDVGGRRADSLCQSIVWMNSD